MTIIAIVTLGTLAGAEDCLGFSCLESSGHLFFELPGGIPSFDTIRRAFGSLDPQGAAAYLFA